MNAGLIGIVLVALSTIFHPPFEEIKENRLWYHELIDKGFGNLENCATTFFIAGVFYTVLISLGDYLWTSKLQTALKDGFDAMANSLRVGTSKMSVHSVVKWIENSNEASDSYKDIIKNVVCKCYGKSASEDNSYANYVLNNLIDTHARDTSITRYDLSHDICVSRESPESNLLKWEEKKDYKIACPAGEGKTVVASSVSTRADAANVQEMIDYLQLKVTINRVERFSFQPWLAQHRGQVTTAPFAIEDVSDDGAYSLFFDGKWIEFSLKKEFDITSIETEVGILETSFITVDDRSYHLGVGEPTYHPSITMRLVNLDGWQIQKPSIGAMWHHKDAKEFATIEEHSPQWVKATVHKWVLPGIWATIEWAPP